MKKTLALMSLLAVIGFGFAGVASAQTTTPTALPAAANNAAATYKPREVVITGQLTAISATTLPADLTVKITKIAPNKIKNFPGTMPQKDGSITIHLTSTSKIVRQFFGKADLSELAVGDIVWSNGRLQTDGSVISAMVRDTNIKKSFASQKGAVTAVNVSANSFTFTHKDGKVWTAFVTANTKFMKAGKTVTLADLVAGDVVAINGVVRQTAMQITADKVTIQVKKAEVKKPEVKKPAEVKKNMKAENKTEKKANKPVVVPASTAPKY